MQVAEQTHHGAALRTRSAEDHLAATAHVGLPTAVESLAIPAFAHRGSVAPRLWICRPGYFETNIRTCHVAFIELLCYPDSRESAGAITFEDDLDTVLNDTAGHLNATVHQLRTALANYPFPDYPNPDDPQADDTACEPEPANTDTDTDTDSEPSPAADSSPVVPRVQDRVWFGLGADGRFRLNLECDEPTGMIIQTALRESRDRLFHDGHPDVDWIDTVRDISERSLDAVADLARRDRFRIHIHLDTDGTASDDRGRRLPDAIAKYISCDALITPTVIHDAIPISIGRSGRMVPERSTPTGSTSTHHPNTEPPGNPPTNHPPPADTPPEPSWCPTSGRPGAG